MKLEKIINEVQELEDITDENTLKMSVKEFIAKSRQDALNEALSDKKMYIGEIVDILLYGFTIESCIAGKKFYVTIHDDERTDENRGDVYDNPCDVVEELEVFFDEAFESTRDKLKDYGVYNIPGRWSDLVDAIRYNFDKLPIEYLFYLRTFNALIHPELMTVNPNEAEK